MKVYSFCKALIISSLIFYSVTTEVKADEQTIWNSFMEGHSEFKNFVFPLYEEEFLRLVKEGQSPKTLFVGCSDSRMDPQMIVRARPGDLFVIRNAGNFIPPYNPEIDYDGIAATLQYAVEGIHVSNIIVCGHNHCGAIEALFTGTNMNFVKKWLKFGEEAKEITLESEKEYQSKAEMYRTAEKISVLIQLENLMTYPFIKKLVDEKKLYLHGWYYQIESGDIEYYNPVSHQFNRLGDLKKTE